MKRIAVVGAGYVGLSIALLLDKSHQVIPPDALYSMKNSNAGYISYEAVFNDSKVSSEKNVNIVTKYKVMVPSSYSILQMILK